MSPAPSSPGSRPHVPGSADATAPAPADFVGSGSAAPTGPGASATEIPGRASRRRGLPTSSYVMLVLAVLITAATWTYLVFTQPSDSQWQSLADSRSSAIALVGFLVPAVLGVVAVIRHLPVRTLTLMPVALALNIVTGQVVGTMGLPLPLYLDSIGTVLVGALAGPAAGLVTGVLSALVWGTFNATVVPFAAAYAFVGIAAGLLGRLWTRSWWKVALAAAVIGFITALLSAPIASFIYGGTAGTGTGLLVTLYRSLGAGPLEAVFLQSWTSDPLDKVIVFTLVWLVLRAMPQRTRRAFSVRHADPADQRRAGE